MGTAELDMDIKSGKLSNVYLFYGQDVHSIEKYVKAIVNKAVDENSKTLNLHEFEGHDFDVSEFSDACEALPVFAEYSCVTAANIPIKNKKLFSKDNYDIFINTIKNIPETTILVIYYNAVDICEGRKNPDAAYKRLIDNCKKCGKVNCFAAKTSSEYAKEIAAAVKKKKGTIGSKEAAQLAQLCSGNTLLMYSEVEKLTAYANGAPITSEMINDICVGECDTKIYNLTDAVAYRNKAAALKAFDDLKAMQTEPITLLYSITNSVVDLYRARVAVENRCGMNDVISDFGYGGRAFVIEKAFRSVGRADSEYLKRCIDMLIECEGELKKQPAEIHFIQIEKTIVKMLS